LRREDSRRLTYSHSSRRHISQYQCLRTDPGAVADSDLAKDCGAATHFHPVSEDGGVGPGTCACGANCYVVPDQAVVANLSAWMYDNASLMRDAEATADPGAI